MPRSPEARSKIGGWPLAAAIAAVLVFLFFVRRVLLPFILAATLAFVLTPVVDGLSRRARVPRWSAAALVYGGVLLLLAVVGVFIGLPLARNIADVISVFPQTLHRLLDQFASLATPAIGHPLDSAAASAAILDQMHTLLGSGMGLALAAYGAGFLFGGVLFLVLLLYFLVSGKTVAAGVFWLVPPEYRREVDRVMKKIVPLLWRYLVGLLVVVTYTMTVAWLGFSFVFHLPRAPLLGVAVGLLELIPLVGPAAAIAVVALTASQQTTLFAMAGLVVFAVALRVSIDQLVGPLVLGHVARLHPVVIIFAFLSGAVLFGVVGLIFAVPIAASIKIVLGIYYAEPVVDRGRP